MHVVRLHTERRDTLKVIVDPTREANRKEYGKSRAELTAEFLGKKPIFAWRDWYELDKALHDQF